MANFNWAYVDGNVITGSGGPDGAVQFRTGARTISGSSKFTFSTSSDTLELTGTFNITGALNVSGLTTTLSASNLVIRDPIIGLGFGSGSGHTSSVGDRGFIFGLDGNLNQAILWDQTSASFVAAKVGAAGPDRTAYDFSDTDLSALKVGELTSSRGGYFGDNVGIGTVPGGPLHVYKAAASGDHTPMELLRLEQQDEGVDMSAGHGPAITFYVGETGGSDHGGSVAVVREEQGDADSAAAMSFYTAGDDSAPTEKMRITSTGKVAIANTSPSYTLDVTGDGRFTTDLLVGDDLSLTSDSAVLNFGAGNDVTFTHDGGTGMDIVSAGTLDIGSTAGSMTIGSALADGQTLKLGKNGAVETIIAPHGTAGSELYSVINTAGTTDGSDAAGAILLSSVAGGIGLAWADGKDLWAEGGRAVITANEDAADCIKLHADAGSSQTISVVNDAGTSVTEGSAAVSLQAAAGGVELRSTANLVNAINLTVDGGTTSTMTLFNDQGTSVTEGAASVQLLSDAGGIGIKSTANLAEAILLTTDGGTSETIKIHADQGTAVTSIDVVSDAGGIKLSAGLDNAASVHLVGYGMTFDGGDNNDSFLFNNSPISLEQISAPSSTTNKLYNVSGTLTFNGTALGAGGAITSYTNSTNNRVITSVDSSTVNSEANLTFDGSTLTVTGDAVITDDLSLNSDSAVLNFGDGNDVTFTHDGGTGMDIVSAGTLNIGSTAGSMTIGSALADGQTLKLGKNGAVETIIAPSGAAGSELYSVINTAGTTDGADAAGAILLSSVAGGIGLAWADSKDLWAEGGRAVITANENAAAAIKLHADAGANQTIIVQNDAGTTDGTDGAGSILLAADAGGIGLAWADGKDLWAEGGRAVITANEDAADCIKLHADAGSSQTISVVNDAGTSVTEGSAAVSLQAAAGGVELRSTANLVNAINITNDGGTTGTITIFNDQGTSVTEGAASIQLLTDAGGIGIKSTANLAEAILLTTDGGAAESIKIHADQSTVDGATGAGAIELQADAGGICIEAAADKDVFVRGGQIKLIGTHDTANAIYLRANTGTSETIKIHADQGTAATSIDVVSDAGGIKLTSGKDDAASINLVGYGMTFDGGDQNDTFLFNNSPLELEQISAPSSTTDKLWNQSGILTFGGDGFKTGGVVKANGLGASLVIASQVFS